MTTTLAKRLGLPQLRCHTSLGAVSTLTTITKHMVKATITSRSNSYSRTLTFVLVPRICELVPDHPVNTRNIKIPSNLKLADPEFHLPAEVDILISSGPALSILCVGQIDLSPPDGPDLFLQKTRLGWVIGGSTGNPPQQKSRCYLTNTTNFDMEKFWRIEESPQTPKKWTIEEAACEENFLKHTTRDETGRYVVALPLTEEVIQLGESRLQALRRLKALQRKLNKTPALESEYSAVINEYQELGHMTQVSSNQVTGSGYFIPHHAVIKESSLTTRVRVVFDGSARTSTGLSLNEVMMTGPTIHTDIFRLLLRFRIHTYVLTADIEKMYRQFLVRPEDRKYQQILWQTDKGDIQTFQLNTVTFGLAASPFLATRCIHQLAEDEGQQYPEAAKVLKTDTYVDDVHILSNSREKAISIRDGVIEILKKGCLNIRQWASNDSSLLRGIDHKDINQKLQLGDDATLKTLGIFWETTQDVIKYTVQIAESPSRITKRSVLSEIAKIFDPIGLLGPVITKAKIFLQILWTLKLDWDESLPASVHTEWVNYYQQLPLLQEVQFTRSTIIRDAQTVQLHGFCDASQRAYGACLYLRTTDRNGYISSQLLCAKSRVAPLKSLTIPRLELCAARELASLYCNIKDSLEMTFDKIVFWTDSTIVIHWINTQSQLLLPFVANRVSDIQTKTDPRQWKHVRTHDNPADYISRGLSPTEFLTAPIWKHGPVWLSRSESEWPNSVLTPINDDLLEKRKRLCLKTTKLDISLLERYSDVDKLERIVAYCLRFKTSNQHKNELHLDELRQSRRTVIRLVQGQAFGEDILALRNKNTLNSKSQLIKLTPFIDQHGILRVGGRLDNADVPFAQRHPILLPKSSHITQLYIAREHRFQLHSGIQNTLYALRRRFWIIDGRNTVRNVIRTCVTCRRYNPPSVDYIMGNLPASRVTHSRPFSKVGIDFCGPFFIKEKRHRNRNKIKVYVAVFVCFATKAVHLEVVSDMTTDAFIAALRRFISRRGYCSDIYSDNGTNFVGAFNQQRELYHLLKSQQHQEKTAHFLRARNILWHFIPARAPNFGGLWEAAVKSFKHHLRRLIGSELFTYEDLNTLVIEIEAVLNSRPITPLSSDPNDLAVLTPGHFLIGESITTLPEEDFSDTPRNRLSTFQHIQKIKQQFWNRWYKEYITELTVRHKWTKGQTDITEGTIVLIKEDNMPPLQWLMGKVIKLHPGKDGVCRVATIKTATSTIQRSMKKLAPLTTHICDDHQSKDEHT